MEEKELKKEQRVIDNASYKERFQFLLSINENIICQRYFRINGFNLEGLESEELMYTMNEIVDMIKQELVSKSRTYMWYTNDEPTKLTGFLNYKEDTESGEEWDNFYRAIFCSRPGIVVSPNGEEIEKTYFTYPNYVEKDNDDEKPQDGEFTFKFAFLVDEKPVYEYIWDANVYPKYIRNSVDLSNSDAAYRDRDPLSLHFSVAIIRRLTYGRSDLIYQIIKKICDTLSNTYTDTYGNYTKKVVYSTPDGKDKVYNYSSYNKVAVNEWRKALEQKTRQYENWVNNNIPQKHWEYIERYM